MRINMPVFLYSKFLCSTLIVSGSGKINFNPETDQRSLGFTALTGNEVWGSEIDTKRFETSAKLGYVFPEMPYQSFGFQLAYSNHQQDSYFGVNRYDIQHQSMYSNFLFNSIIGDTRSKFKTGINFTYDSYDELVNASNYDRKENSIGAFFEYAFDNLEDFSMTAGLRIDTHNLLGTFLTPRLHLRYTPWEKGVFRASAGRGKRSANIFAENQQLFASTRQINIDNTDGAIYGLNPEIAWNYGISYLQKFNLFDKKGDLTFDFYRTDFSNQVVVDWEDPQAISFYDLEGKSIANSFQLELNYDFAESLTLRTAYSISILQRIIKKELCRNLCNQKIDFSQTCLMKHLQKTMARNGKSTLLLIVLENSVCQIQAPIQFNINYQRFQIPFNY